MYGEETIKKFNDSAKKRNQNKIKRNLLNELDKSVSEEIERLSKEIKIYINNIKNNYQYKNESYLFKNEYEKILGKVENECLLLIKKDGLFYIQYIEDGFYITFGGESSPKSLLNNYYRVVEKIGEIEDLNDLYNDFEDKIRGDNKFKFKITGEDIKKIIKHI